MHCVPSTPEPYLTSKLQGFGTTIFAEMSGIAVATNSINLGQGFPDTDAPRAILDAAIGAINGGLNQYPPGPGMPVLRNAIAAHQQRFYALEYDPDSEVLVTVGATEALAAALLGMLDAGDEVVVFDPMFDSYAPCIAMAGGIVKPVLLRPPNYTFDPAEFLAAVTSKTKLILLNTPHNPTGRVFTTEEMQFIADVAMDRDVVVLTDDVYEHLVFDDLRHVAMASLPGMRDRSASPAVGRRSIPPAGRSAGCAARQRWFRPLAPPSSSSPMSVAARSNLPLHSASACPTSSSRASPRGFKRSATGCCPGSSLPVSTSWRRAAPTS